MRFEGRIRVKGSHTTLLVRKGEKLLIRDKNVARRFAHGDEVVGSMTSSGEIVWDSIRVVSLAPQEAESTA